MLWPDHKNKTTKATAIWQSAINEVGHLEVQV
eukprot:COSAG04_NODE_27251_length_285_cov_0.811828_1_plen_31_part_01